MAFMMKRICKFLYLSCIAVLILLTLPGGASAASGSCGDRLTWTLSGGSLTIRGTGPMTSWSSVTETPWYDDRDSITSITVGNGVTTIEKESFYYCSNLQSITTPATLTRIGAGAFEYCSSLRSIVIPSSVTEIGQNAFNGCTSLANVNIPYGIKSIQSGTFNQCTSLDRIDLPSSIVEIGDRAFADCYALQSVGMSDNVMRIGWSAFSSCKSIKKINIPQGVKCIESNTFYGCTAMNDLYLHAYLQEIKSGAFGNCTGLSDVTIPESVTKIEGGAFKNCTGLTDISYKAANCSTADVSLSSSVFSGCSAATTVNIGDNVEIIPPYLFCSMPALNWVSFPESSTKLNEIGAYAFYGCKKLTEITIPSRVMTIAKGAFANCDSIKHLGLSGTYLTNIGAEAFSGCCALTEIDIPIGVYSIGEKAFFNCYMAKSLHLGSNVTKIGNSAFDGCSSLQDIPLPDGVEEIGERAFAFCIFVTSVKIPDSVQSIGKGAFYKCDALTKITIPFVGSSRTNDHSPQAVFGHIFGAVTKDSDHATTSFTYQYYADGQYYYYNIPSKLTSVTVTDAENIPEHAFYNCTNITSVSFHSAVTSIGADAFKNCSGLKAVRISDIAAWCKIEFADMEQNPLYYARKLYLNNELITHLTIPDSVTTIGNYAFIGCNNLTDVTVPDNVTAIGDSAFCGCGGLNTVTIGNGVTTIGSDAFGGCGKLTEISVDEENANYCTSDGILFDKHKTQLIRCPRGTSISEYTIPNSVITIVSHAFSGCRGLKSITVPDGVTTIGSYAFSGCTGLKGITVPGRVTTIDNYAFYGCTGLKNITIPNSVTTIGSDAFSGCTGLTGVTIGNGLTVIGDSLFSGCAGLKSITVPDSVTTISRCAFEGCSGLISVTVGNGVTYIGDCAFWNCTALTDITMPDGLTTIGNQALEGCSSLTSITIPESVTSIGNWAFDICDNLTDIYYNGSRKEWDKINIGCSAIPSSAAIHYRIAQHVEGISLNKQSIELFRGETFQLIPIITPEDAADQTVSWTSSDETVVSVDNGTVTGIGTGTAFITAITHDGEFRAVCNVTVYDATLESDFSISGGTITGYHGNAENVYIPRSINGSGVTKIGSDAFQNCKGLKSIIIPDSVTSIGDSAFFGCSGLTSIAIPNSVKSIGSSAFYGCTGLTSITIPDSVTRIGYGALKGCTALTKIAVDENNPGYCTSDGILFNKNKTDLIRCPQGISMREYTIPDSVRSIVDSAFEGCTGLTNITMGNSVTWINVYAFFGCSGLTSITIPDSVTSIGSSAFGGCTGLKNIIIGSGVTSIGSGAFGGCTGLTEIAVDGNNPGYCALDGVLFNKSKSQIIRYPGANGLNEYVIPDSVTNIGIDAFDGCSGLTSVTIPDGVRSIGYGAFMGCSGLISATIPDSVTSIEDYAFYSTSIKDVYYKGSENDRAKMDIAQSGNSSFLNATWHYNGDTTDPAVIEIDVTIPDYQKGGTVMAALYNESDTLIGIKSYPPAETVKVSFEQSGAYIKVLQWDMTTMKPLAPPQNIKVN